MLFLSLLRKIKHLGHDCLHNTPKDYFSWEDIPRISLLLCKGGDFFLSPASSFSSAAKLLGSDHNGSSISSISGISGFSPISLFCSLQHSSQMGFCCIYYYSIISKQQQEQGEKRHLFTVR